MKWIAEAALLDARPGGTFSLDVRGNPARGEYLEVDPPHRVVFTWGIEGSGDLPPGTSTVEVVLQPDGDDTVVTLTHRDLPTDDFRRSHQEGWSEFLGPAGRRLVWPGLLNSVRPPRRIGADRGGGPAPRATAKRERVTVFAQRGLDLAGTAECTRGCPTMFLEESPEQQQLRAELRQYYARAPHRRGAGGTGRGRRGRRGLEPGGAPDRQGRLARHRLAEGVRRAGPAGDGPVHLLRRDPARRCAVPLRHHQHCRTDHHALRHRRAEVVLPPADPRRRAELRHRLHRARGRHRPGVAAHAGRARRRGVRRQRRQDLHQRCRPGRLRLAGRAAPIPTSPSTRASPSCACRRRRPASSGRSSTPSAG